MDEVETMTRAGETVGEAVGKGLRAARIGVIRASHVGAEASSRVASRAEQRLAERGIAPVVPPELTKKLADRRTRRARKAVRRKRRELAKSTRRLGRRIADQVEPRKRRRWPWLLALLIAAAATASVVLSRRPQEVSLIPEKDRERDAQQARKAHDDALADRS